MDSEEKGDKINVLIICGTTDSIIGEKSHKLVDYIKENYFSRRAAELQYYYINNVSSPPVSSWEGLNEGEYNCVEALSDIAKCRWKVKFDILVLECCPITMFAPPGFCPQIPPDFQTFIENQPPLSNYCILATPNYENFRCSGEIGVNFTAIMKKFFRLMGETPRHFSCFGNEMNIYQYKLRQYHNNRLRPSIQIPGPRYYSRRRRKHNSSCEYLARQFPKYKSNFCQYVNILIEYLNTNNIDVDLRSHLRKKLNLTNIITQKHNLNKFLVEALIEIPRELFVNVEDFDRSLIDSPIQFGSGQTISQPSLVGYMINLLKLEKLKNIANVKILEIGTASGYNAVLLADSLTNLNCHNNTVYTIELIPSLIPKAIRNISNLYDVKSKPARMTKSNAPQRVVEFTTQLGHIVLYKGDGTQSLGVTYDRIIVTAGGEELPLTFIKDLKYNGVLVMPIQLGAQQYIVNFVKLKPSSTHLRINSIRKLNLFLNKMMSQNIFHKIINFKGLCSLTISLDIPVRFVPLKSTS